MSSSSTTSSIKHYPFVMSSILVSSKRDNAPAPLNQYPVTRPRWSSWWSGEPARCSIRFAEPRSLRFSVLFVYRSRRPVMLGSIGPGPHRLDACLPKCKKPFSVPAHSLENRLSVLPWRLGGIPYSSRSIRDHVLPLPSRPSSSISGRERELPPPSRP